MINQSATSECGPEVKCLFVRVTRLNKTEERRKGRKIESGFISFSTKLIANRTSSLRTCTCPRNYALTSPNVVDSAARGLLEIHGSQDIVIMRRTVLVITCVLGFVLAGSPRLPRTSADQRGTRSASHNNTGATSQPQSSRNLQRNR